MAEEVLFRNSISFLSILSSLCISYNNIYILFLVLYLSYNSDCVKKKRNGDTISKLRKITQTVIWRKKNSIKKKKKKTKNMCTA